MFELSVFDPPLQVVHETDEQCSSSDGLDDATRHPHDALKTERCPCWRSIIRVASSHQLPRAISKVTLPPRRDRSLTKSPRRARVTLCDQQQCSCRSQFFDIRDLPLVAVLNRTKVSVVLVAKKRSSPPGEKQFVVKLLLGANLQSQFIREYGFLQMCQTCCHNEDVRIVVDERGDSKSPAAVFGPLPAAETGIPKLVGWGAAYNSFALGMEELSSCTLAAALQNLSSTNSKSRLSYHLQILYRLSWVTQICNIVAFIHSRGVLHKNLNIKNFVFRHAPTTSHCGDLVLTDFSMGEFIKSEKEMASEVQQLACLVYELLTIGRVPSFFCTGSHLPEMLDHLNVCLDNWIFDVDGFLSLTFLKYTSIGFLCTVPLVFGEQTKLTSFIGRAVSSMSTAASLITCDSLPHSKVEGGGALCFPHKYLLDLRGSWLVLAQDVKDRILSNMKSAFSQTSGTASSLSNSFSNIFEDIRKFINLITNVSSTT